MRENTEEDKYCLIIFVYSESYKKFFKKMVEYIKTKFNDRKIVRVILKDIKGIFNYNNAEDIFENEIQKYPNISKKTKFKVICCYDNLKRTNKVVVDWKSSKKNLSHKDNISNVYEIKIKDTIEDWFLEDIDSLNSWFNSKQYNLEDLKGTTGEDKIKDLFLKNACVYQKGFDVLNFIDQLNLEILYNKLKDKLKILVDCLFKDT